MWFSIPFIHCSGHRTGNASNATEHRCAARDCRPTAACRHIASGFAAVGQVADRKYREVTAAGEINDCNDSKKQSMNTFLFSSVPSAPQAKTNSSVGGGPSSRCSSTSSLNSLASDALSPSLQNGRNSLNSSGGGGVGGGHLHHHHHHHNNSGGSDAHLQWNDSNHHALITNHSMTGGGGQPTAISSQHALHPPSVVGSTLMTTAKSPLREQQQQVGSNSANNNNNSSSLNNGQKTLISGEQALGFSLA